MSIHDISSYTENSETLSLKQGLAYALPTVVVAFLVGPVATILQGVYAKYFGLPLATVATIILIARLFDAISDPVIGHLSDRYQHDRSGRKLFIMAGGILFIASSYCLYAPLGSDIPVGPKDVSKIYFLFWFLAFYLSFTLFEIPHLAWGGEITVSANERNKLYGFRALASYLGMLLFFSVPLLPFFDSDRFTPETLVWSVTAAGILMLPLLIVCIVTVPVATVSKTHSPQVQQSLRQHVGVYIEVIFRNQPFMVFLGAFFCSGAALGMWYGLMYLFVDVYLDLGHKLSLGYMLSFIVTLPALGLWVKLANLIGKNISWGIGMILAMVGILGTGFLAPGESNWLPLLLCMVLISSGSAASVALAPSLLADIVDYSTVRFGVTNAATYFAIYTLTAKANVAIGGAVGLAIVASFGFDPLNTMHSGNAVFGMRLAISWIPVLITIAAVFFIIWTPINSRRHGIIQRRLENKKL